MLALIQAVGVSNLGPDRKISLHLSTSYIVQDKEFQSMFGKLKSPHNTIAQEFGMDAKEYSSCMEEAFPRRIWWSIENANQEHRGVQGDFHPKKFTICFQIVSSDSWDGAPYDSASLSITVSSE